MRQGYSQKKSLLNIETVLNSDELLPYEFLGVESISERVRTHFEDYHWPGNLREFEALLHRLIDI